MAEKSFQRKHKRKAAQPIPAPAQRQGMAESARDTQSRSYERDFGAGYSAGPAFGLALAHDSPGDDQGEMHEEEIGAPHPRADTRGKPLPRALRRRHEAAFGHDFGAVRIHRGSDAERTTEALGARAFTCRNHIWLGSQAHPSDHRLMAHELTHVVQQGHARALPHRMAVGLPTRAANAPTYGVTAAAKGAQGTHAPVAGGAVQRWSVLGGLRRLGGRVVSGVRSVGRGIVRVGRNLMDLGRRGLMAIVRRVAPDFARLFERGGIRGFLRELVARGFRSLFGGLIGRARRLFSFGNIGARFRSLGSSFVTIVGQLARNDCSGITRAAERFGNFMSRTFEPISSRIRRMADAISGFFRDVWNAVGAPIMRFLRSIGGTIWAGIRRFINSIGSIIRRVKNALGRAWSRVKGWFGITAEEGTAEGGGIWNWIKEKAAAVWNRIKGPLQPILGPLRIVGGVLLVLSPVGPILLVTRAWPHLRRAFQWVRERWRDLNLVVRARRFFANTVLPAVRDGASRVGNFLVNAADWFLGLLGRISSGIQSVTGRLRGGILAPLGRVVGFIAGHFRRMVEWARNGLRWAANNARSLFRRLIEFIQPIIDVLRRIIAIAVNPFGIPGLLMGSLWRIVPECLKGPIINFILDIIIRVLRAIPPLFQLGILWPFIRAAALGFLERLRGFATARKVNVSNKIAKIISGMSPGFAFGYLRGIFLGVWDAIVGPFLAIAQIFQLPQLIRNFLRSLGLRLCDLIRAIRCFAATVSARAIGVLSGLLQSARDLLSNPRMIIELLRCALQTALATIGSIAGGVAEQMMRLFEGPEDRIGEMLGRVVGSFLVDAVIGFFTAGASAAVSVISRIANFLRTIGRNIMRVLRLVAQIIPKLLGFIRKIGGLFRRAGSGAGSFLARIGRFFRRVANWFRRVMQRVGRRFRRRGRGRPGRRARPRGRRGRRRRRDRDRRRGDVARRERRKRLVIRIITRRLRRGIGKVRLFALMTYLKFRYRIRRLRMQRRGRGQYNVHIANSAPENIPSYEVYLAGAPGAREARLRRPSGSRVLAGTLARISHSAGRQPTPSAALEAAGYDTGSEDTFGALRSSAPRPNWVETRLRRELPSLRRLAQSAVRRIATAALGSRVHARNLGKVEHRLRRGRRTTPPFLWQGGHLIANSLGGPGSRWNFVPMTQQLNTQAFYSVERWLRAQWNRLRGPASPAGRRRGSARLRIRVTATGYRDHYRVPGWKIERTGISRRLPDNQRPPVTVSGFIPSDIRVEAEFHGQGVQARRHTLGRRGRFYRPERVEASLRATSIEGPDDVMMRYGSRISSRPAAVPPRTTRRTLVDNRAVFSFRQWRP